MIVLLRISVVAITIGGMGIVVGLTPQANESRAPQYRIGHKERTVKDRSTLVLYISVEPPHFNRNEMVALALKLNKDFGKEQRLYAIIFNNHRAARDFVFSQHSPTFERDVAAMRGGYSLDRVTGEEYISFSPDPAKPRDEIRIVLGKSSNQ